jgi:Acyl-CoA dehydrogenase, N-terminal domain/Tetracyclin repressor-like, C-terminal domain
VNLDLTDEQKATQRLARDFAQNEVEPVAEELDKEKRFPYEIVAKLDELGLMGVPDPEEYGGRGADTLSYALVIEELARFPPWMRERRALPLPWGSGRLLASGRGSRSSSGAGVWPALGQAPALPPKGQRDVHAKVTDSDLGGHRRSCRSRRWQWSSVQIRVARSVRAMILRRRDGSAISVGRIPLGPNALRYSERVLRSCARARSPTG